MGFDRCLSHWRKKQNSNGCSLVQQQCCQWHGTWMSWLSHQVLQVLVILYLWGIVGSLITAIPHASQQLLRFSKHFILKSNFLIIMKFLHAFLWSFTLFTASKAMESNHFLIERDQGLPSIIKGYDYRYHTIGNKYMDSVMACGIECMRIPCCASAIFVGITASNGSCAMFDLHLPNQHIKNQEGAFYLKKPWDTGLWQ